MNNIKKVLSFLLIRNKHKDLTEILKQIPILYDCGKYEEIKKLAPIIIRIVNSKKQTKLIKFVIFNYAKLYIKI